MVDIRNREALDEVFTGDKIDGVVHCSAILAHGRTDPTHLWTNNVNGTATLLEVMKKHGVQPLVFTSTNCLWGEGMGRPVREDDAPKPVELYGRSKQAAEDLIRAAPGIRGVIIRCPTIISSGRLGLLSILFEFIDEGRKVWTVGGGKNRYQFVAAEDLAAACLLALDHSESDTFHIGSDYVKSLGEVYEYVIQQSGSRARVAALPLAPTLLAMKLAYHLRVSPLGPYHYKMIAEDFVFDTTRIKKHLGWRPTVTNEHMLWRAYQYYAKNRREIEGRRDVSAHKRGANMGAIRLLKWLS